MGTFRDMNSGKAPAKGGTFRKMDAAARKPTGGEEFLGAVHTLERAIPFADEGLDRARAWLTTAGDIATGKAGPTHGDGQAAYQRNLAAQRQYSKESSEAYLKRHPKGGALVEGVGMAIPAAVAMFTGGMSLAPALAQNAAAGGGLMGGLRALASPVVKGATTGGLAGAVAGLGGDGDAAERVEDARQSAAVGATVGAVLPPAVSLAAKGVNRVAQAVAPQVEKSVTTAGRILANRAPEAVTPLPKWNSNVLPFEQMGRGGESLARAVAAVPGPGQDIAETVLRGRQAEAPGRMMASTLRDLGDDGSGLHPTLDKLDLQRLVESKPLYEEAFAIGPVQSTTLDDLARRPSIKEAFRKAFRLAQEEGEDAYALGLHNMENPADWVTDAAPAAGAAGRAAPPPRQSLTRFLAAESGAPLGRESQMRKVGRDLQQRMFFDGENAERWAQRAWEEGYFPGLTERPSPHQVYEALDRELRDRQHVSWQPKTPGASVGDEIPDDFGPDSYGSRPEPRTEPVFGQVPTAKSWDYVKRGLDELIEEQRDPVTKRLPRTDTMRLMDQTRREMRSELVRLNPAYGPALAAYTGPSRAIDAAHLGRSIITGKMDPEDIATGLSMMSKNELDALKLGMARGLADQFRGGNPQRVIRRFATDQVVQDRLRAAFNNDAAFGRFMDDVIAEAEAQQSFNRVLSGSRTTPLREDIDAANEAASGGAEIVADVVARRAGGEGLRRQAVNLALRNWHRIRQPGLNNPEVSRLLGEILFKGRPAEEVLQQAVARKVITPEQASRIAAAAQWQTGQIAAGAQRR